MRTILWIVALLNTAICHAQPTTSDFSLVQASPEAEAVERRIILDGVYAAIDSGEFFKIERYAEHFRLSRARTPSGIWKLRVLHIALQHRVRQSIEHDTDCSVNLESSFSDAWLSNSPEDPTAIITKAYSLVNQGWCHLGEGFASEVAPDGWISLRSHAAEALSLLHEKQEIASVDPEYFAVLLNIYRALSFTDDARDELLERAVDQEPYYLNIYFQAAWSFLPQWGGSAQALERLSRRAAENTHEQDAFGYYMRIYWFLDECRCRAPLDSMDWRDMKRSMRDVYERYPVRNNGEKMFELACRANDKEEALYYLRRMYPEATSDGDFAPSMVACENKAEENRLDVRFGSNLD